MPSPYSMQGLIDSGDIPAVGNPITQQQQPQQQQQPPEDPSAFFQAGPGVAVNDPNYQPDREAWYQDFVKGYYNQNFNDVKGYIDFVKSLGVDAGTESFSKQQALKHMPPKLKVEYEEMQATKKADAQEAKQKQKIDEWNADPQHATQQMIMGFDGKVQALKTDPETSPYFDMVKTNTDIWKSLQSKKGAEIGFDPADKVMEAEVMQNIIDAQREIKRILKDRRMGVEQKKNPNRQLGRPTPEQARQILERRRLSAQR